MVITIAEFITGLLDSESIGTILQAFGYKLPGFLTKIIPVNALLASAFTLSRQKATNELTAILAGGFSRWKYVGVILSVACIFTALQFAILGFIEPAVFKHKYSQEISVKTLKKEGKFLARSFLGSGKTWYKNENYFVSFSQYDASTQSLKDISLYYFDDNKLTDHITASKAQYHKLSGLWNFQNVIIIDSLKSSDFHHFQTKKELPINLTEVPDDFKTFESDIKTFDFFELYSFVKKLENTGIDVSSYSILFYEKISLALVCLIFAFFPLVSINNPNKRSSSTGLNIGLALIFAIFYWFGHSAFLNMGSGQGLSPLIASFLMPVIVCSGLLIYWRKKA